MSPTTARIVVWAARLLGVATCLFIAMFALDAFNGNERVRDALADFAVHLIPAAVLLVVVALSWQWPWMGAVTFLTLAVLYATTMSRGRLDWIAAVSGPLFLVGALFLWSWHCQRGPA